MAHKQNPNGNQRERNGAHLFHFVHFHHIFQLANLAVVLWICNANAMSMGQRNGILNRSQWMESPNIANNNTNNQMNVFETLSCCTKNVIWLCIRRVSAKRKAFQLSAVTFRRQTSSTNAILAQLFAFNQRIVVSYTHLLSAAFIINITTSDTQCCLCSVWGAQLTQSAQRFARWTLRFFGWNGIYHLSFHMVWNNQFMSEFYVASKRASEWWKSAIHVEERFYVSQKLWYDKD